MIPVKTKGPKMSWLSPTISNFFDMDKFVSDNLLFKKDLFPAINVVEKEDNYEVEVAVPGFSKKDFTITIDDGMLNISAEKEVKKSEKTDNFIHKEFSHKSFIRSLLLPDNVNKDTKLKAHYNDGILRLLLRKIESKELHHVKVIEVV
jgi:HSP20 family protein